jgi:hypothetical protein
MVPLVLQSTDSIGNFVQQVEPRSEFQLAGKEVIYVAFPVPVRQLAAIEQHDRPTVELAPSAPLVLPAAQDAFAVHLPVEEFADI